MNQLSHTRPRGFGRGRRQTAAALAAGTALLTSTLAFASPAQAAEVTPQAPVREGCTVTIPAQDGVRYSLGINGVMEDVDPGQHDLTASYPAMTVRANLTNSDEDTFADGAQTEWYGPIDLDCAVTVEVACESITFTDLVGWETTSLRYNETEVITPADFALGPVTVRVTPGSVDYLFVEGEMGRTVEGTAIVPACDAEPEPAADPAPEQSNPKAESPATRAPNPIKAPAAGL